MKTLTTIDVLVTFALIDYLISRMKQHSKIVVLYIFELLYILV